MALDIASDITTGVSFLMRGDLVWVKLTFAVICNPWVATFLGCLINLVLRIHSTTGWRFKRENLFESKDEMIDCLLEFPLMLPFK